MILINSYKSFSSGGGGGGLPTLLAGVNGGGNYPGYNLDGTGWLSQSWGSLSNRNAPGGELIAALQYDTIDLRTYLVIEGANKTAWFSGRQIWINGVGYTCTGAGTFSTITYATISTTQLFFNGVTYTVSFVAP